MTEPHSLEIFHPLIAQWFSRKVGEPTDIQSRAWPEIAAGRHVLITAPTGSGKTMAAFLWGIDRLVSGNWPCGQVRLLYISPLKALNNDVRRNLIRPLSELNSFFRQAGREFPRIRVLTRSGDTPADERRRMAVRPPEILITTPESINILLSSKTGRPMLTGIASVILDEIHAVVAEKRGTHLITAVDRLVPLCGEFQRIALSATVRPEEAVAEFVGGFRMEGDPREPVYLRRPVSVVRSDTGKRFEVSVRFPERTGDTPEEDSRWPVLADCFREIIRNNRSTLLFANSRRLTEKITRMINEAEGEILAYPHHGSLSRELRLTVEQRLKNSELKAIVATNSLELGIDIGELDQVALIQTPMSISSAIQRIGRSGHGVGEVSRGLIFPTHGLDLLKAGVAARAVRHQHIEELRPLEAPLDVLAQVVLSMTGVETWDRDRLFSFLRSSSPYRNLSRRLFGLVLEMLAGRYADRRLRELKPRISIDKVDNTVRARPGALMLIYLAGGTIPDRGYFDLRIQESGARIGELDEEFVWERDVGDTFAMGNQTWQIRKITHSRVEVAPGGNRPGMIPFWRAEPRNRDFHFSEIIAEFLERADTALDRDEDSFLQEIREHHFMDPASARRLIEFLKEQKKATRTSLPHRRLLLVEHFDDPLNRADSKQVILHTLWGGRINRPFAMALAEAWERAYGYPMESFADDDAVLLILPHRFGSGDILGLVNAENLEGLLRARLERTGFFGARFRENAGRALLLPKAHFKRRMPLWLNRLRAKKLMESVMNAPDFPILLETWRTCLRDEFDLENLKSLLDELAEGRISVGETCTTAASPFAQGLVWQQTNRYMYEDDTPESGKISGLGDELFREVAGSPALRPVISGGLVEALVQKLHRTAPGYSPPTSEELLDWVKERLIIPLDEWEVLLSSIRRDHGHTPEQVLAPVARKLLKLVFPGARIASVCALENIHPICRAFGVRPKSMQIRDLLEDLGVKRGPKVPGPVLEPSEKDDPTGGTGPDETVAQWLSYYGPVTSSFIKEIFGLTEGPFLEAVDALKQEQRVVTGRIREAAPDAEVCDRENLEILLRMARRARRPSFRALPSEALPLFMAAFQGPAARDDSVEALENRMEQLFGICMPAPAWEEYILPARLDPYYPSWLDSLMQTSELCWFGCGDKRVAFSFEQDLELFMPASAPAEGSPEAFQPESSRALRLIPGSRGKYGFSDITHYSGLDSETITRELWRLAWQGEIANDTFEVIRSGILNGFRPTGAMETAARSRRRGFNRWKSTRPLSGNWFMLDPGSDGPEDLDEIRDTELKKDRIRQLFRRYGILFRELLMRELPPLQWSSIFRTLRLMELSGEILSGHFFEGIPGIQFISHEAYRFLQRPLPEDAVYWMNASDPASLCGTGLEAFRGYLPPRIPSIYLVFHGRKPVLTARQNAAILEIRVPPDHPRLLKYYSFFKALVGRSFNPRRIITVETINGQGAVSSPYAPSLKEFGFSTGFKGMELRRSY